MVAAISNYYSKAENVYLRKQFKVMYKIKLGPLYHNIINAKEVAEPPVLTRTQPDGVSPDSPNGEPRLSSIARYNDN